MLLREIIDNVSLLLDETPEVKQEAAEVDRAFLLAGHEVTANKLPAGVRGLPHWTSGTAKNLRGLVPI